MTEIISLYVFQGEEFSRVLAKSASSPTGYTSMTGAFPTTGEAISAMRGMFPGYTVTYADLETNEPLALVYEARNH